MSVKRYLSFKTKNYSKNYEKIADFTTENDITRDTAAGTETLIFLLSNDTIIYT